MASLPFLAYKVAETAANSTNVSGGEFAVKGLTAYETWTVETTERFNAILSLVCSAAVLGALKYEKFLRKKPLDRALGYAALGNILNAMAAIISVASMKDDPYCERSLAKTQAFLVQAFMPTDAVWSAYIAVVVFHHFRPFLGPNLPYEKIERYLFFVSYGFFFTLALGLLGFDLKHPQLKLVGPATIWCWIGPDHTLLRLQIFYYFVWTLLGIATVAHMATLIHLGNEMVQRKGTVPFSSAFNFIKVALVMYSCILACWIPSSGNRIWSVHHPGETSFGWNFAAAFALPLQGTFNAIIFFYCARKCWTNWAWLVSIAKFVSCGRFRRGPATPSPTSTSFTFIDGHEHPSTPWYRCYLKSKPKQRDVELGDPLPLTTPNNAHLLHDALEAGEALRRAYHQESVSSLARMQERAIRNEQNLEAYSEIQGFVNAARLHSGGFPSSRNTSMSNMSFAGPPASNYGSSSRLVGDQPPVYTPMPTYARMYADRRRHFAV